MAEPVVLFRPADGSGAFDLNEGDVRIVHEVRGTGLVEGGHQFVKTPNKRGATYVKTVLPERFVEVEMGVFGTDFVDLQAKRRAITLALNSDLGVGRLDYRPDPDGQLYSIDAILEGGADLSEPIGPAADELTLVFRCPDPTFYDPVINTPSVASSGGLEIPLEIPMDIVASTSTLVIDNTGDIETFPIIRATRAAGSFTSPAITNQTTGKVFSLSGLSVGAGDELVIDLDVQTAEVEGANVMQYRTAASERLGLERGSNTLAFTVASGDGTVFTVEYYTRYAGA